MQARPALRFEADHVPELIGVLERALTRIPEL
jgi:hypothetical protein